LFRSSEAPKSSWDTGTKFRRVLSLSALPMEETVKSLMIRAAVFVAITVVSTVVLAIPYVGLEQTSAAKVTLASR
jgi:hypothetical protein